jgi:hypothetical protein
MADLWYLKYGYTWTTRRELDPDWQKIASVLMQSNLADYEMLNHPNVGGFVEIIKIKEK